MLVCALVGKNLVRSARDWTIAGLRKREIWLRTLFLDGITLFIDRGSNSNIA